MSYDSISPIDGRYRAEAEPLARYFSEEALNSERVKIELAYLKLLVRLSVAPKENVPNIESSSAEIKALERRVGHDVKAVEIFLRDSLARLGHKKLAPFVHLGLTSEDTNNLAFALLLKSSLERTMVPTYSSLARDLAAIARKESSTVMVARTHGRPAVPTTFGKELAVFAMRIAERVSSLGSVRLKAKFSGAVGTYASFSVLGNKDWRRELAKFVNGFGVDYVAYSAQVVPWESYSDLLHYVVNINQLVVSLSRDLWLYQTLDYVHFRRRGKVSSSTMPQKVNPVDLENAEGQAEISNAILGFIAYRLQVTRLQRDLSDSVIRRMVGQGLAHSLIATNRLISSLASMTVERSTMEEDLGRHPEVYAEREQLLRRLAGDRLGYERVMSSVRRGKFRPSIHSDPYLGLAEELAANCPQRVAGILHSTNGK